MMDVFELPGEMELVSLEQHTMTVRFKQKGPIAEQGHALLELEKRIHREFDPLMEVFLEVLLDTNILRGRTVKKREEL